MKRNMGTADRLIRAFLIAPVVVAVALLVGPATIWGIVAWAAAGIMLVTAAIGFCPIYALLGIHTLPRRAEARDREARAGLRKAA